MKGRVLFKISPNSGLRKSLVMDVFNPESECFRKETLRSLDFEIWSVIVLFLIGKLHAVLFDLTLCVWSPHSSSPEGLGVGGASPGALPRGIHLLAPKL